MVWHKNHNHTLNRHPFDYLHCSAMINSACVKMAIINLFLRILFPFVAGYMTLISLFNGECFPTVFTIILQAFVFSVVIFEIRSIKKSFLTPVTVELELSCV